MRIRKLTPNDVCVSIRLQTVQEPHIYWVSCRYGSLAVDSEPSFEGWGEEEFRNSPEYDLCVISALEEMQSLMEDILNDLMRFVVEDSPQEKEKENELL